MWYNESNTERKWKKNQNYIEKLGLTIAWSRRFLEAGFCDNLWRSKLTRSTTRLGNSRAKSLRRAAGDDAEKIHNSMWRHPEPPQAFCSDFHHKNSWKKINSKITTVRLQRISQCSMDSVQIGSTDHRHGIGQLKIDQSTPIYLRHMLYKLISSFEYASFTRGY